MAKEKICHEHWILFSHSGREEDYEMIPGTLLEDSHPDCAVCQAEKRV